MIANKSIRKNIAAFLSTVFMLALLPTIASFRTNAEDSQEVITEYGNLWTGTVSAQVGVPVKWIVNVPEDTEPKGCSATIKIPGLGWGDTTNNTVDEYVTLKQGNNLVYEFTPKETGDFIFTCRMGSGCHLNYIHITEDGGYNVPKPDDPTDITAERDGEKVIVGFNAPEAPEGAEITGYKATAIDENGSRKKATSTGSPIVFEKLDENLTYTIRITTLSTSGASDGDNEFILETASAVTEEKTSEQASDENSQININENKAQGTKDKTIEQAPDEKSQININENKEQEAKDKTTDKITTVSSESIPKTGVPQPLTIEAFMIGSVGLVLLLRKKRG